MPMNRRNRSCLLAVELHVVQGKNMDQFLLSTPSIRAAAGEIAAWTQMECRQTYSF